MRDPRTRGVELPAPGPKLKIARLKAGENLWCRILSPAIWLIGTHWIDGHSMRCTRDTKKCLCDERPLPYRVKGYLFVQDVHTSFCHFVELTPRTISIILKNADTDKPLRGLTMKLERGQGGNNSRLYVKLLSRIESTEDLPIDQDPNPTLEKLWSFNKSS